MLALTSFASLRISFSIDLVDHTNHAKADLPHLIPFHFLQFTPRLLHTRADKRKQVGLRRAGKTLGHGLRSIILNAKRDIEGNREAGVFHNV